MKKIALILSGCGHTDGTEVTEAVAAITSLSLLGAEVQCFAPTEALEQSNKIARGSVKDLTELHSKDFDALVLPGGYGATQLKIDKIIQNFHSDSSPIGAICIAPMLVAKALGQHGVALTIGKDKDTASKIEKLGAQHVECEVDDFITDRQHKVVTTPAYMYDANPGQVFTGIQKAMAELFEMA